MPSCFDLDSAALWPGLRGPNAPGEPIIGHRLGCFSAWKKERAGNIASPSPKLYARAGVCAFDEASAQKLL